MLSLYQRTVFSHYPFVTQVTEILNGPNGVETTKSLPFTPGRRIKETGQNEDDTGPRPKRHPNTSKDTQFLRVRLLSQYVDPKQKSTNLPPTLTLNILTEFHIKETKTSTDPLN